VYKMGSRTYSSLDMKACQGVFIQRACETAARINYCLNGSNLLEELPSPAACFPKYEGLLVVINFSFIFFSDDACQRTEGNEA